MRWLIEDFRADSDNNELIEAIKRAGHNLEVINLEYFNNRGFLTSWNEPIIFHGSILLAEIGKSNIIDTCPFIWLTLENYNCSKYYPYFSDILFNNRHCFINVNQLIQEKFFYYGIFGKESLMFIRPDDGNKSFQAGLVDLQDLDRYYKEGFLKDKGNNLVVISTPKNIRGEYRFIVTDEKEIIAYSTYQYQGQLTKIPSVPSKAAEMCNIVLDRGYFPDKVFCIDIVEDANGDFFLMELNSFCSAGLYAANKNAIVKRVSEIAEQQYNTLTKNYE